MDFPDGTCCDIKRQAWAETWLQILASRTVPCTRWRIRNVHAPKVEPAHMRTVLLLAEHHVLVSHLVADRFVNKALEKGWKKV